MGGESLPHLFFYLVCFQWKFVLSSRKLRLFLELIWFSNFFRIPSCRWKFDERSLAVSSCRRCMLGVSRTSNRYENWALGSYFASRERVELTKGVILQNWVPLILNLLALIGIAIHGIVYYNKLPGTVVYHYDAYVREMKGFEGERATKTFFVFLCCNFWRLRLTLTGKSRSNNAD